LLLGVFTELVIVSIVVVSVVYLLYWLTISVLDVQHGQGVYYHQTLPAMYKTHTWLNQMKHELVSNRLLYLEWRVCPNSSVVRALICWTECYGI